MTVNISIILSIISVIACIATLVLNMKKGNKTDGFELGNFMGEMRSEIASIKTLISELKQDNKENDNKISKAIDDHEKRYHSK